jgi:hypothetical protein
MHYEISQLHSGWQEISAQQEDRAIKAIQEFTGWNAELAEEAFSRAQRELAEAEQRITEDAAQAYFDKHGRYPTCQMRFGGYRVSRRRIKPTHSSESSRVRYAWYKEPEVLISA